MSVLSLNEKFEPNKYRIPVFIRIRLMPQSQTKTDKTKPLFDKLFSNKL